MSEFVPFEISKKLKEKGFKEECVAHYYSNDPTCLIKNTALADYVRQPFCIESIKRSWNRCELNPCSSGCYYDVPTISQVMKWLREEKGIHVNINLSKDWEEDGNWNVCDEWVYWTYNIQKVSTGEDIFDYDDEFDAIQFQTYGLAAHDAIEYVLDNLI